MTGPDSAPSRPPDTTVPTSPEVLGAMTDSAAASASPAVGGVLLCKKKSWFAIRVIDDKDKVVPGLTLKLNIPDFGGTDRVTSKRSDPLKIQNLAPGGKGDVKYIDCVEAVWEAIGDIT